MAMAGHDPKTESVLALLPVMTQHEWALLALACVDQAGLPERQQATLRNQLLDALERNADFDTHVAAIVGVEPV